MTISIENKSGVSEWKIGKKIQCYEKKLLYYHNCDSMTTQFRSVEPRKKQYSDLYFDVNVEVRVLVMFSQIWAM